MPKIIFVHPAIRSYRKELFELLSKNFNIEFIFVEDYEDNQKFLKNSIIKKWKIYRSGAFFFYRKGVVWRILKDILFSDYQIWVASGLNHFTTHLAFLFVKLRGKKFVLFSEDWWLTKNFKTKLAFPYMKLITRSCDFIIAAGSKTKEFFIKLGAPVKKVNIAVNATSSIRSLARDSDEVVRLRERLEIKDKVVILRLGRIVRYKGLDILIESFADLEKRNNKIHLLVVGEGDFKEECQLLAQKLKVKNITFQNSVAPEKVNIYYGLADIFVLPARFLWEESVVGEAWGFVVNEAMSAGLPVVVTEAVAAADDLINNENNGFIIPAENVEKLRDTLKLLVADKTLREKIGQAAKRFILKVTPQRQFESFAEIINKLSN